MTGLWGGSVIRVPRDPPPYPVRLQEDRAVGGGTREGPVLTGLLTKDDGGDFMTGNGLQGGREKQKQPQDSSRTPPHVGYASDPG